MSDKKISCQDALKLVHDFIDGELDGVSTSDVQTHFDLCKRCYPHLRLEQRFRDAVRRACTKDQAPSDLRDRVQNIASGIRSDS
jgi:anti-sigma factor (TIGR02949 family)